ncbi:enhanced level of genomic instability 1 [Anopheles ziemanni]|uniref:enhanced level of genomic instability 1 n=1 Tax=Anopheles ziemanni TaxID=345580 RepID=UPI002660251F|nr:enhanced level of genomic instability 1 [Anopheles ziemanni]
MMAPAVSSKTESIVSSSSSSSVSSLSSASGNTLSTLSKVELDRLIAENMTSVLKSLKKRKHAKKHARIRQAAAAVEAATVDEGADTMSGKEENQSKQKEKVAKSQKKELNIVRCRVSPRKNNQTNDDSKTKPQKESLKELQPKTKELEGTDQGNLDPHDGSLPPPVGEKNGKENKTINAFQLMMGARSKAIGSNSPGRELDVATDTSSNLQIARQEKAKRKLQLQQWAERKGSGKRKIQEDAEGEYIDHQLKKRAKRMKKLISNMAAEEEDETKEGEEVEAVLESTKNGRATPEVSVVRKQSNNPVTMGPARRSSQSKKPKDHPLESESDGKKRASKVVEKENTAVIDIEDSSNDEFLKHLSSPRKKKDSLLGYFNKVSPVEGKKDISPATGSRRSAKPRTENGESSQANTAPPETPPSELSTRPRRSCANRIKDYASFERFSPEKEKQQKPAASNKKVIVTPLKIINVQSPSAMQVVRSPSLRMFSSGDGQSAGTNGTNGDTSTTEWPTTPKSVKLAPVFSRATVSSKQQPVIDPEKARARQLFLMSGIPEKMRQEMEKRAAYEEHVLNESPVFPLVSHVTQLEDRSDQDAGVRSRDLGRSCIRVRPAQPDSPATSKGTKSRKIRYGLFTGCSVDDYEEALIKCIELNDLETDTAFDYDLPEIEHVKEIVRDYKQRYQHFPVFKCYKQFRTIYQDYHKKNSSSSLLDESIEIIEPCFHCRNGELLFTEKYKPQNTEQILVNYVPATLLKRFLSPWQDESAGGSRRTGGALNGDHDGNDVDFEHSNGSSSSFGGAGELCNHVVLVGPPGSGKTCNVYAVAKEMNFNVLEINASSRRKGKIILQELLEATQSHLVRQKTERSNSLDGLLVSRQKVTAVGKKGGLLNGGFSCLERRPSFSETNGNGSKKLSLILIEDADIVFEQDDGFLGAINQLVATSKRPIVLTTTNPSCPHMARYMARNNVIRYIAPGIANVAKFLSLLALVERIPIDQHDLGRLYAHNRKDMRKTLNELQFFIQSGGDMTRFLTGNVRADDSSYGHELSDEASDGELNETRSEELVDQQVDDETGSFQPAKRAGGKKVGKSVSTAAKPPVQHTTLYQLFTRNQNEEMLLRLPLEFDTLWCNMELVLREVPRLIGQAAGTPVSKAKKRTSPPKRPRRRDTIGAQVAGPTVLPPDVVWFEDLSFLYENISRAETGWGVTRRNRVRYGRDLQDEQQQQQLANEIGHALVEGSWIDWFNRARNDGTKATKGNCKEEGGSGAGAAAKSYDCLRKLEHEQRQTIASYIGVNGVRSRVTTCDYEPMLRQICRTERDRSAQERRGSRFYHYLRNFNTCNINTGSTFLNAASGLSTPGGTFSVDHFDALSHRFEEHQLHKEGTEELNRKN